MVSTRGVDTSHVVFDVPHRSRRGMRGTACVVPACIKLQASAIQAQKEGFMAATTGLGQQRKLMPRQGACLDLAREQVQRAAGNTQMRQ